MDQMEPGSSEELCLLCKKDLTNLNEHNKEIHKQSCVKKNTMKRKTQSKSLFSFYQKKPEVNQLMIQFSAISMCLMY